MHRAGVIARLFLKLPRLIAMAAAQCEVAQALADDLGCNVRVREALGHSFERWDGRGFPRKKRGEAIPLSMRLVQVAGDAQLCHRAGGLDAVAPMLAARRGHGLDPILVDTMSAAAPELLASLEAPSAWDAAIAAEPGPPDYVGDGAIDGALQAIGAFADLKSSYTRGHSSGVAELAAGAAERLGLGPDAVAQVRRAAYVHDVGARRLRPRVGKRGRDRRRMGEGLGSTARHHTEQILARPPLLARLGALGALDHSAPTAAADPHRPGGGRCPRRARAGGRRHVPGDARRRRRTDERSAEAREWRHWSRRRRRVAWIRRRRARGARDRRRSERTRAPERSSGRLSNRRSTCCAWWRAG